jgi:hypothetical protein
VICFEGSHRLDHAANVSERGEAAEERILLRAMPGLEEPVHAGHVAGMKAPKEAGEVDNVDDFAIRKKSSGGAV